MRLHVDHTAADAKLRFFINSATTFSIKQEHEYTQDGKQKCKKTAFQSKFRGPGLIYVDISLVLDLLEIFSTSRPVQYTAYPQGECVDRAFIPIWGKDAKSACMYCAVQSAIRTTIEPGIIFLPINSVSKFGGDKMMPGWWCKYTRERVPFTTSPVTIELQFAVMG